MPTEVGRCWAEWSRALDDVLRTDSACAEKIAVLLPDTKSLLAPLLTIIPMQVLSAAVAQVLGLDVDQPRNLAKSVTVE